MSSYILSNANRFYTGLENNYGQTPAVTAQNRFPALKLTARNNLETADRRDKTGSRTFVGIPAGLRRTTSFDVTTYMTSWGGQSAGPAYGPLFQASMGAAPAMYAGGAAAAGSSGTSLVFAAPHGLAAGQGVSCNGEIRFVTAIVSATAVQVNAGFSAAPAVGTEIAPSISYFPATQLPSVSIFDYWDPSTALQRILCGAAVDKMTVKVNGDFHTFEFEGMGQDLLDSASFTAGEGQMSSFPVEPALGAFDYSIVPGNMGEAWLGIAPSQFYTITSGTFQLDNGLDLRSKEFGTNLPLAVAPGPRSVTAALSLYEMDDAATQGLYQAARQQSPISLMFQLGQQTGQVVGVYMMSVVPVVPEFDDTDNRLQWKFQGSKAQGTANNEIVVAFG
ncbi:MAG TPA: hypothetical protein VN924_10185 [Bryobacteraceae bacterium]|jgi:hypothetical protein|nr:hypothetical protein [Bryobacteraceae bacterium]